ncbi:hypothetical protein V1227_01375 [Lentzea sp. DG1S-22]|uniref:hypothetical protein n=1 Tax=Lentzea sp. DG1S-22 TaxID=3108822 RepID=UPI002E7A7F2D|nr:hypothetical protein [Lentzea sp. DG1S-22]WVH81432.1 hypothetical protein V1227_01375 [Lentzea sp. DG1S-22]
MSEERGAYVPQDTESFEGLDEDNLQQDPLEEAVDPPEDWSGSTKYGMTEYEQAHPRPLDERLREERGDIDETGA